LGAGPLEALSGWYKWLVRTHVSRRGLLVGLGVAVLAPAALTALLVGANPGNTRDYVYLYLGIVAILGLASGLRDALLAAGISFLLVDFFFVRPVHTFQFADTTDLINLAIFFGTGGIVGTVGSLRRAAQFRAESLARELQRANIELARLAETERQVRALEETDRMRRELLANVSHELRTPMASILTGTTTLLRRDTLSDDMRPEVESLAAQARRLNRLVSDLLDMTRIEGGIVDLRPTEVDIREAIEAAVERLHRIHPDRAVAVDVPASSPEVVADWQRLGQVLDNLLENADHWSPPDAAIRVTAAPSPAGEVAVRVIDAGPGIPADLRERVFERFVRGDAPSTDREAGMGLGLPIVRGLIDAQRGRVWLEDSAPGEGARVAFSLPAASGFADAPP
jgi:two-component system sensor histidine kinase KdpD